VNVTVWVDGAYHSVKLPTYALGFFEQTFPGFDFVGPVQTDKPRVSGAGVSGGFSRLLPHGSLPRANARIGRVRLISRIVEGRQYQTASAAETNCIETLFV
jgi:hypothetical protein